MSRSIATEHDRLIGAAGIAPLLGSRATVIPLSTGSAMAGRTLLVVGVRRRR